MQLEIHLIHLVISSARFVDHDTSVFFDVFAVCNLNRDWNNRFKDVTSITNCNLEFYDFFTTFCP